jgi:hypothetical protein
MSTSTVPLRPLTYSKIDQARLILTGTLALILTILALWLLIAVFFRAPRLPDLYRWGIVLPPDHVTLPVIPVAMDREIPLDVDRSRNRALEDLEWAIEEQQSQLPGTPIVLYLSAVGVSTPGDSGELRAYLVPRDGLVGDQQTLIPAAELLELLRDRRWRSTSKLLLLDVGQPGSDRALGVFANGFLRHLKDLLEADPDLLVMTSCAPGQLSWSAEPLGGTIFGVVVVETLTKFNGQGRVSDLHAQVQAQVSRWARVHRGAIQTPQLWGNLRRDFRLPRYRPSPSALTSSATKLQNPRPVAFWGASEGIEDDALSLEESLKQTWQEQEQLAKLNPHPAVHAPLAWRGYLDELLQAERHLRAGRLTSAEMALHKANQLAAQVREQTRPQWSAVSWKQALTGKLHQDSAMPAASPPRPPAALKAEAQPAQAPAPAPAALQDVNGGNGNGNGNGQDDDEKAEPKPPSPIEPPEAPPLPEGRIADRYTRFLNLQGGVDPLHPRFDQERLATLRSAAKVAEQGDRSALDAALLDPAVIPWTAALVDQGDQLFLEALDKLFGRDPSLFPKAGQLLVQAESCYTMASEAGNQILDAFQWLQKLRAELPYLGEWMAYRPEGMNAPFRQLLDRTARLADWLDTPPEDWDDLPLEELQRRLRAALDGDSDRGGEESGVLARQAAVEGAYLAVLNALNDRIRRVGGATSRVDSRRWREVDALLRIPILHLPNGLPTLSPEERWGLLELARSLDLNPRPDGRDLDTTPKPIEMDPIFWKQGFDLADLELGLLRLAGVKTDQLGQWLLEASQCWEIDPNRAFDAIEKFSEKINRLRPRDDEDSFAFELDTTTAKPEASASGPRTIARQRQELAKEDRLARVLPASALGAFSTTDPARKLVTLNQHAFFTWQVERLARNMELAEAGRLLIAAGAQGISSQELAEARRRVEAFGNLKALALNLDQGEGFGAARPLHRLKIQRQGELPLGEAAIILPGPKDEHPSLIAVNDTPESFLIDTKESAERTLDFDLESVLAPKLEMAAFFRGRVYSADGALPVDPSGDSVSLEIRQAHGRFLDGRKEVKVPDQFLAHPGQGYLQPNSYLDYKIVLRNNLSRPVTAEVHLASTGGKADHALTKTVVLAPGDVNEDAIQESIRSSDFQEGEPIHLNATVTEAGTGRSLSTKPLDVVFQLLKAEDFIEYDLHYALHFGWPTLLLQVRHRPTNTVFFPADVTCTVQPVAGLEERYRVGHKKARDHKIYPGGYRWYEYKIIDLTIEEVEWALHVNGQRDAIKGTAKLQTLPQAPPNAGPQTGGGGAPGY